MCINVTFWVKGEAALGLKNWLKEMLSVFRHPPTLLLHFQYVVSDEACFRRLVLLVCARSYAPPWVSFQVSARAAPSQRPSLHPEPPPAAAHTQRSPFAVRWGCSDALPARPLTRAWDLFVINR